jgi:outer membrane receptor protein involved in Fe transport
MTDRAPGSHRRALARATTVVIALLVALFFARGARADDVADEADLQFNIGADAYQKGDYSGALEHFLASNRLVANRNVEFNIARTYERLRKFPDAYRWYVRALDGETDKATRDRLEAALRSLAPNVAVLRVETDPPGAKVYLDRKDLGERGNSPQRLGLDAGKYRVIAELAGYEDATSAPVDVRVGAESSVQLKLVRILGTVHVVGDSEGATVHVDSEDAPPAGTVPCDVAVPPGRHTFFVTRPGAQTATVLVDVAPRATVTVRPQVVALTGTLVVDADERDAIIEIDGKPEGFSPSVLTIPVGTHHVRVSLKGFRPVERDVDIHANESAHLDVELESMNQVEAASRVVEDVEDAPGSVSVIPYQEIRSMRYPTVAEALRGTRGVYSSDDRGYVSLGFRGFGRPGDYGNRTLVLLNGQPMNDDWLWSSYVGYDLRTDLDDVERIEVVRGPGSVLYGTGAFSGVVNIVTRGPDEPPGAEVGVSQVGDGVSRARARVQTRFGDHGGIWTSVAAGHGQGRDFFFPEYVSQGPPSVAGNARGVDGFDVATWTGQARYDAFKVQWSVNSHRKTLPTGEFATLIGDGTTRQTDTRAMIEAKFEPKISPQVDSTSRVHANYYGYAGHFAHTPENGGIEYSTFDGQWVGAEQRFVYKPRDWIRATVGAEAQDHINAHQFDTADAAGGVQTDDTHSFTLLAAYVAVDAAPVPWLKAELAGRFDAYQFSKPGPSAVATPPEPQVSPSAFSPRMAVILKPTRIDNIKVLAGKAFRAPSDYELYYIAPGGQLQNPNLHPENAYSAEVEYSHRFTNVWTGLVAAYENLITDLIAQRNVGSPDPVTGIQSYAYENVNAPVATLGMEAELRREWKEGWMVAVSYSFQRSRYVASTSPGDVLAQNHNPNLREVPNAPEHLASIRGAVPILSRALQASTRLSIEGPRWDRNDDPSTTSAPQGRTEPSAIWDIVLSGTETRWKLSYAFGVYNAFDWRYSVPVSKELQPLTTITQSGRTFLATAGLQF